MKSDTDIVLTIAITEKSSFQQKVLAVKDNDHIWSFYDKGYAYYDTKKAPKCPDCINKVFMVCDGEITGYFTLMDFLYDGSYSTAKQIMKDTLDMLERIGTPEDPYMRYVFNNWTPIKPIKKTGFQGLRYRDFEYEELNGEEEENS